MTGWDFAAQLFVAFQPYLPFFVTLLLVWLIVKIWHNSIKELVHGLFDEFGSLLERKVSVKVTLRSGPRVIDLWCAF
jgi:hypothetical protein